ncbi:MAG: RNA polymerase sporulation sigma factor SigH, partial [Clostridia bacterium]|nr:RNA polymerase sporulation sigma factor SigH [Clostridia bacterium]
MMQINLNTLSDEELVLLSVKGDNEAEETILHRYKNYVKSKARTYYLIGADNDDIVQEGMIGLYKAVRDFKPDKNISFKTFADVCITRQILTAIRTANRNKHTPLNASVSINAPLFDDDSGATFLNIIQSSSMSNPEELYIFDESLKEIKNEISKKLSDFENTVLELYL